MTSGMAARPRLTGATAVRLAGTITGMELAYLSTMTDSEMILNRVAAEPREIPWTALAEDGRFPRSDTLCHRLLQGAPARTDDVPSSEFYATAPLAAQAGIRSYVGVPVTGLDGSALGTLCALDRDSVQVSDRALDALVSLAALLAHEITAAADGGVWLSRTSDGWRVIGLPGGDAAAEDLTTAMVLADLLADDLSGPGARPARGAADADELSRLRISVSQLEHALTARVVVEQAIGVLSERRRVNPRAAFEILRGTARGTGRRVHSLAAEIVASAINGGPALVGSLARAPSMPTPTMVASAHKTHQAGTPGGPPVAPAPASS